MLFGPDTARRLTSYVDHSNSVIDIFNLIVKRKRQSSPLGCGGSGWRPTPRAVDTCSIAFDAIIHEVTARDIDTSLSNSFTTPSGYRSGCRIVDPFRHVHSPSLG